MKIEVGEYIRSTRGEIIKIENEIMQGNYMCYFKNSYCNIKAHSKNIIDLIEVGDYVNSIRVEDIIGDTIWLDNMTDIKKREAKKEIKTIVTKEQFNSVMYKVVE